MKHAYVAGTCDTKGEELRYVCGLLEAAGVRTILVDLSTQGRDPAAGVQAAEVAACHPLGAGAVLGLDDRGQAVTAMAEAFERFIRGRGDVAGLIGLGGSGGTALVTPAMRALPVGVPKVMVSTVASGNVAPYVGPSDICMLYSVVDVQGLNRISRVVLANAAHALAGMILRGAPPASSAEKPALGLTMFGVTTPCVQQVCAALKERYDCLVFHATGTGGRSMEKLADSGFFAAVVDVTTTEVADLLVGGIFSAGEDRLGAIARTRLPYVGSVGALDMVNFGARETVPVQFAHRNLYVHNPQVTLMRTTREENARMGAWIGAKLNACAGPVRFLLPEKGLSALDAPGKPFHDPEAGAALYAALEQTVKVTNQRRLIRLPYHINDAEFAAEIVSHLKEILPGA